MSIQEHLKDDFFKLAGLPKKGGFFKSGKQGQFIMGYNFGDGYLGLTNYDLDRGYGLPELLEGQKAVFFIGENIFAHGNRGRIPYELVYIYDKFGVVRFYHVGGNGHGDQWSSNKDKVTLKFERDEKNAPAWVASFDRDQEMEVEKMALLPTLENTRQIVSGTVLSIKEVFSDFGSAMKMTLLLTDFNKVYATIPKNIIDSVEVGSKLSMNVTLKQAEAGFYFGSRPAKGSML